jgi:tetratricopeptide (TPR) repeat protein
VHGEIASLQGSWLKDSRRFDDAHQCLKYAVEQFELDDDPVAVARALMKRADCYRLGAEPQRAVHTVGQALDLLHPLADARLVLFALHNLCRYLVALDEPERADALFRLLAPNYEALDDRQTTVRRSWLEGVIAHRLGDAERAETALRRALDEYVAMPVPYYAALVSLDLCLLLLDQGRAREVTALAATLPPLFAAEGIRPEATAAVVLLHRAAARRRLDAALLDRLRDFFERAQVDRNARLNP